MNKLSLTALARQQLKLAATATSGRSSQTVFGGHTKRLRQTVVALLAGHELGEHDSPGEATLQVLTGQLQLIAGEDVWKGSAGDMIIIPPARHSVTAIEDVAFLLTVSM